MGLPNIRHLTFKAKFRERGSEKGIRLRIKSSSLLSVRLLNSDRKSNILDIRVDECIKLQEFCLDAFTNLKKLIITGTPSLETLTLRDLCLSTLTLTGSPNLKRLELGVITAQPLT
jgi:hypothetical protein